MVVVIRCPVCDKPVGYIDTPCIYRLHTKEQHGLIQLGGTDKEDFEESCTFLDLTHQEPKFKKPRFGNLEMVVNGSFFGYTQDCVHSECKEEYNRAHPEPKLCDTNLRLAMTGTFTQGKTSVISCGDLNIKRPPPVKALNMKRWK